MKKTKYVRSLYCIQNNDSSDYVIRLKEMRKLKSHNIWQDVLFVSDYYISCMLCMFFQGLSIIWIEWKNKGK